MKLLLMYPAFYSIPKLKEALSNGVLLLLTVIIFNFYS